MENKQKIQDKEIDLDTNESSVNMKQSNFLSNLNKILNKNDTKKFINQIRFTNRKFEQKQFKAGSLKFAKLYTTKKTLTRYLLAIIIGIIMSLFSSILIQSSGLYTGGFGAICQGIARITFASMNQIKEDAEINLVVYNLLFWGLYLMLNIPLIVFAYKKINKQFAMLSIIFLISMQGSGFIWGMIPQISEFKIFGSTNSIYPQLQKLKIQTNIFFPQWFPNLTGDQWAFDWNNLYRTNNPNWCANTPLDSQEAQDTRQAWCTSYVSNENNTNAFLLILYSTVYALISSTGYALVYILGGSTGGSDFLTIYLSQEKNKNVGTMFIIINAICMITGITIGSYASGCIADSKHFSGWEFFFSANLFISLLFIILNGLLMNKLFPWHKMIKIEIFSNKYNEINNKLKEIEYTHPTTIVKGVGGYSGHDSYLIITICMTIELPSIIKTIRSIDDKCLVSATTLNDVDGKITMQRQTF